MKKVVIALNKSIVSILSFALFLSVNADTWTDPNTGITWTYESYSSKATLLGCSSLLGSVDVPATVNGFSVVCIGNGTFENQSQLQSLTIPKSVSSLSYGAIKNCPLLRKIVFKGKTNLEYGSFSDCENLTSFCFFTDAPSISVDSHFITRTLFYKEGTSGWSYSDGNITGMGWSTCQIPVDGSYTTWYDYEDWIVTLSGFDVTLKGAESTWRSGSIGMPCEYEGLPITKIGKEAFANLHSASEIVISKHVQEVDANAFDKSSVSSIAVDNENMTFKSSDGLLLTKDGTRLIACPVPRTVLNVPDGVKEIAPNACRGHTFLTTVKLPSSLVHIADYQFCQCSDLQSVDAADNEKIGEIGAYAFKDCANMSLCRIFSDKVGQIGDQAFYGCESLQWFYFSCELTNIAWNAFCHCESLTSINIPASVKRIEYGAFSSCLGLKNVTLHDGLQYIGGYAFNYCENVSSFTIPSTVTRFGQYVFRHCLSCTNISFKGDAPTVQDASWLLDAGESINGTVTHASTGWGMAIPCTWYRINLNYAQTYKVSFRLGSHASLKSGALTQTVAALSAAVAPEIAVEDGWRFTGWDVSFDTVKRDLIVNALYTDDRFAVTFDIGTNGQRTGGGELIQSVRKGQSAVAPTVVANEGWIFAGWDTAFTNINSEVQVSACYCRVDGGPYTNEVAGVDWVYYVTNGEATLGGGTSKNPACKFYSSSDELTVPNMLGGCPVRCISSYALSGFTCYAETISLPSGLKDIASSAFCNTYLKSVVIPAGVTNIGESAFAGAHKLKTVSISGTGLLIGESAFQASGSDYGTIWSVNIASTNLVIKDSAFRYQDLDSVVISGKNIDMGYAAFYHRTTSSSADAKISISGEDISVGSYAFANWKQKNLAIELDGRITVGSSAFAQCGKNKVYDQSSSKTWLAQGGVSLSVSPDCIFSDAAPFYSGALGTVLLPTLSDVFETEGWLRFSRGQFYFYTPEGFTHYLVPLDTNRTVYDFAIPEGTASVPDYALGETRFATITVPQSVTTIGQCAFAGCLATNIVLPSRLTSIGQGAFRGNKIETMRFPDGVTSVPSNTLANCTCLCSVTFPNSLMELGENVFMKCTGLTNVTFEGAPPSGLTLSGLSTSVLVGYNKAYEDQWQTALDEGGFANSVACQPSSWEVTLDAYPFAEPTNITLRVGDRYEDLPHLDYEWMDFHGWGWYDDNWDVVAFRGEASSDQAHLLPVYDLNSKLIDPSGCCKVKYDACCKIASGTYRDQNNIERNYSTTWGWHVVWYDSLGCIERFGQWKYQDIVIAEITVDGPGEISLTRLDNLVASNYGLASGYNLDVVLDGVAVHHVATRNKDALDNTAYDATWSRVFGDYKAHVVKLVACPTQDAFTFQPNPESCIHIGEISWTPLLEVTFEGDGRGVCSPETSWAHIGYWDYDEQKWLEKCKVWSVPTVAPASGWSFVGWDRNLKEITESTTVTARYEAVKYQIAYANTKGVSNSNPTTYTVTNSFTFEALANVSGARFVGWNPTAISVGSTGEKAVTAEWEERTIETLLGCGVAQTGGAAVWTAEWCDDRWACKSGVITKSSETWVELTVTNATRVVFDWKTSCEEEEGGEMFDGMTLSVDGVPAQTLCGESGWVTDVVQEVAGTGVHTLRWTYAKDNRVNAGEDCAWLANVRIHPVVEVTFDGNGHDAGVVPAAVKGCEGDSFALPSPGSLDKAYHKFVGWQVGDDVLAVGSLVSIAGQDMTIKAIWRAKVVPQPTVMLPAGVSDREGQKYFTTESIAVEVSAAANATVRYTTDGSDPTEQSPVLTGGAFVVDRTMVLKVKAFADDWFASEVVEMSFLRAPWTVSECLNDKLSFASTGDAGWTRDLAVSHDGMASMRSGAIGNRQTSVLTATVNGAGRISFWCKVSSEFDEGEACDGLRFYVDGVEMTTELLGGEMAWTNLSYDVGTDGAHVLKWQYEKDRGDYADVGSDCAWLDEVCWCPDVVAPTLGELVNVFGEYPDVVKNITNEAELAVFNGFLKECSISSADDLSTAQMQYAFQSFKLSEITTSPQLFEAEPVLKIDDLELSGGNLSLTISLTAGTEAIQLAKDRLAEKIRVGTSLDSIVGAPSILDSPSADGTSLTFTISPPQGGQGFVKVIVE